MKIKRSTLIEFLERVDLLFPIPLSKKHDLNMFADKLLDKATLCLELEEDKILSMVAGYNHNMADNWAYISVVATLPEIQGRGVASKLIKEFICISESKHASAVHLYAGPENQAAISMYRKLGFVELKNQDDVRPEDVHFVRYLDCEKQ